MPRISWFLTMYYSQYREIFDHFEHYSIIWNLHYWDINYQETFFGRDHPYNEGPTVVGLVWIENYMIRGGLNDSKKETHYKNDFVRRSRRRMQWCSYKPLLCDSKNVFKYILLTKVCHEKSSLMSTKNYILGCSQPSWAGPQLRVSGYQDLLRV